jgi:hypothetical protein
MLREDKKAGFMYHRPLLFWRSYYFTGTTVKQVPFKRAEMETLQRGQATHPVRVVERKTNGRTWWWFEGAFYWEDDGYDPDDVLALIRDRQRKKDRQLRRAKDLMVLDESPEPRRQPIPREIKQAVWKRDGGSCVECGSRFDIQYDHILPFSLGGATTVENLQILCANCNRAKSDSI